jgi:hypothetical protein
MYMYIEYTLSDTQVKLCIVERIGNINIKNLERVGHGLVWVCFPECASENNYENLCQDVGWSGEDSNTGVCTLT